MRDPFIVDGKKFTVTKVDDLTIQVVTPEIYAPFLEAFGGVPIMPKHILAKSVADGTFTSAYGVNWKPRRHRRQRTVSSSRNTSRRNTPCWNATRIFVKWTTKASACRILTTSFTPSCRTMNAMSLRFLSGESDVDDFIYPYEYDNFKAESAKGRFKLLEPGIGLETAFFWFNENTNVNPKPASLTWTRKN